MISNKMWRQITYHAATTMAVFAVSVTLSHAGEIRFWEMPIGCSWTDEYSNGNVWKNTYVGRRNGKYVVQTHQRFGDRAQVKKTEFNDRGLMTRRFWSETKWEKFEPFSCFGVLGKCTYNYSRADGNNFVITSITTATRNSTYRVKARSSKTGNFPVDTIETTYFGLTLSSRNKNFSVTLTEFNKCNIPIS